MKEINTSKVSRVEIIDHTKSLEEGGGRVYAKHNIKNVGLDIQDQGRTLKIFLNN